MSKLSFRGKILLMLATALVALLFMAVSSLLQQRSQIIESRRELLTTAVQSAHSIVASYQAKAASGAMPVEEAQKAAKDALRVSRFGGPEGSNGERAQPECPPPQQVYATPFGHVPGCSEPIARTTEQAFELDRPSRQALEAVVANRPPELSLSWVGHRNCLFCAARIVSTTLAGRSTTSIPTPRSLMAAPCHDRPRRWATARSSETQRSSRSGRRSKVFAIHASFTASLTSLYFWATFAVP